MTKSKFYYEVAQGCTLCGMCIMECMVGAITIGRRGALIEADKCVDCGRCAENCASEAIVRRARGTKEDDMEGQSQ